MRKIAMIFMALCAALMSACVDINLKSELPKVEYYELDNVRVEVPKCGAWEIIALEGIEIPQSLAGKNILRKNGDLVRSVDGVRLNEGIKSSFESMLIKTFAKHCLKIITPPFSGIKVEKFLRIKVLDFGVDSAVDSANRTKIVESNEDSAVDSAKNGADSAIDSANAKSYANVNFAFLLHQNGSILQSDIIAESSAISDFKSEAIVKALQDSANSAIANLANKIIPK
ncbi:hypothetical protein ACWIUD_02330 [Helicobacter sp. 23-1044]